jgi:hypothetical protein
VRAKLGISGQSFPAGVSDDAPAAVPVPDDQEDADAGAVTIPRSGSSAASVATPAVIPIQPLVEKIAALETEVAALRGRLDALEQALGN